MKRITRIVITGGPCGGKTTAIKRVRAYFEQQDYKVLVVPEVATMLIDGGITQDIFGMPYFQSKVLRTQVERSRIFDQVAEDLDDRKILILYDRHILDGMAYVEEDIFDKMLDGEGLTQSVVLDQIDAVFYMMSAAKSCPEKYTVKNNSARKEDLKAAAEIDARTVAAWRDHRHFYCIKGEADFELKIQNLLDSITLFLEERERCVL